ncbi:PaaI family thioesterase [Psychrobacillus lasiicapitis]|uniref:PaaI family thioesterase n=1 Tax=Psychrobacillus lasiicapitis TaxID=1636719 RepID=A0A544T346_9BACI|nr:PaaI family thioesterase [Psychrobacillus lasiicapitis]TQR11831.1 PaaI family thioesterase [Psychrobacillus lasiicapitis]
MKTDTDYLDWLKDHFESSPYWKTLGISFHSLEKGDVCVKLVVTEKVKNINNTLHGGAIVSLLDVAISSTLRSLQPELVTTVSLTTNFINPAKLGKTVYATANVVSSKSRIQYVESEVLDEDGLIIANAVGVFSLIKKKD